MSVSAFISVIALVCWLFIGILIWTCTSVLFSRFEDANKRLLRVLRLRTLAQSDAVPKMSNVVNHSESDLIRSNNSNNNNDNNDNDNDDDDDDDDDVDNDEVDDADNNDLREEHDSHVESSAIVTSVEDRIILRSLKRNYRRKQRATLRASFALTFSRLGLRLRSGQEVLRDVSGHFRSRRLTAVMGPSGSGKTTLLNVLSGRASYGTTTGDVFINGIKDEIARYNKVVGFVPQDDNTLLGELTVLEILETSAATRLPAHYSEFQRLQLVEETLELLGLSEVRFAAAGTETRRSLSGGQRRRLSVGVELVAQPLLLCLDEPTSGLDSSSAKSLVSALRKLSRSGLTIAAVIHQPRYEIFEMFDDVLILGKGGQTVFQGAVGSCMDYFASLGFDMPVHGNPADFLMDVVSGEVRPTSEARARLALATARRRINNSAVSASAPPPIEESAALLPSSDLLAPAMLFECWRARLLDEPDAAQSAVPAAPAQSGAGIAARPLGTQLEFWGWLIGSFLLPYALALIYLGETSKQRADLLAESEEVAAAPVAERSLVYSFTGRSYSMRARYGALTGVVGLMMGGGVLLVAASAVFGESNTWGDIAGGIVLILTALVSAASIAIQWTGAISRGSRRRATFLGNMLLGVLCGPFVLFANFFNMSHKARAAMTCGGMIGSMVLVLVFMFGQFAKRTELATLIAVTLFVAFLTALFAALMRYNHLPHSERRVSGALTQTYVFTMRGLTQMVRNWPGIVLDLGLNLTSGLFLGLVFYQRSYQGPIFSPFGVDVGKTFQCPPVLQDYFQPACALLIVPIDDPLPGEASLSCLAVAMASVASSMRVFGAEMSSFRREAGVGLNTGAYYIGKSLSHLPIVFAAPGVFLMAYAGPAALAGDWTQHYLLLVCVYSISASLAYIVSMLVRRELSQLFGVILLLVFMMFSGANPTLLQLRENSLLGNVLYYPSFLSFLRFSQELFYLIEARAHHIGELTMETLYGFSNKDEQMCWAFLVMFVICFRVIGFLALVFEENAGRQLANLTLMISPLKKTQ